MGGPFFFMTYLDALRCRELLPTQGHTVNAEILAIHLIWRFGDRAPNRQIKIRQYFDTRPRNVRNFNYV